MLEKFSEEQITNALKEMEVEDNNSMRQEFVEGLRNGRPNNYKCFRKFLNILQLNHVDISTNKITETLQNSGWMIISKMRDQIFFGVTGKDCEDYGALRKFMKKLEKETKNG